MSLTPKNLSQRVENLSRQRTNDLSALKSHLRNDLDYLQNEVSTQVSAKLTLNRRQVIHAITDLNTALKQRLGEALFSIFASFNDSLKESDFESLDISRWVNSSLTLFEDRLGTLPLNQDRVLEVINEFTSTWADKVENMKNVSVSNQAEPSLSGHPSIPSRQPVGDINRGRESSLGQDSRDVSDLRSSPSRGSSPSASENKGLFKKVKSLFKAEKSQAGSEGPTKVNLGNDKNFKWDPIKKRYIFEGEDEEEEPEDEGPPPMMGGGPKKVEQQQQDDGSQHSLVKPPENKLLARKKAPSSKSQTESKKPAFMPSKFVPSAAPEEEKSETREYESQDILEDIKRRVDEIFELTMRQEVSFEGIEKMRRDLKILDELSLPQLNDEISREAKLLALESEIESTQVSFVKETYNRKALESELSSLRESYQQSFEKQYALDDHVKGLEKELNMYKDLYNTKNQLWSVSNNNQTQQKNVDNYLKSLKESSSDKKRLIETGNQIRGVELQLQEARASIKLSEGRYEQVVEYLNKENSAVAQLRGLLEDSYKTQKEQDQIIVDLKKENLSLVSKYRGIYGEVLNSQKEKETLRSHLEVTEAKLNELESNLNSRVGTITELEGKLTRVNQKVKGQENQNQKKEIELKDHLKRLEALKRDKENLERKLQEEEQERMSLERRLEELEAYREQLEARIQEEEAIRRQLEEQIREDEVFKARMSQENQEFARRVDDLIFEKENYERRLEETAEDEKRMRAQIEDYIRQLDEYQRHLNQIVEQRDQLEIENRKDREKMLEELMENKSVNQFTSQEREMLHKFSEEISSQNLILEQNLQALSAEISRLRNEKQRSIETVLEFIREIRMTTPIDNQELDSIENYIVELLENSQEDISEKHFKAIGILPKIREVMMREAEAEKARKDLQSDELVTRLNTLEKEKGLYDEQNGLYEADITRLKEIINTNREQIQQFEQKINILVNEGEQIKRENEDYLNRNFELERMLHDKDIHLNQTIQAFTENQQFQARIIQDLEVKFQHIGSIKERTENIQQQTGFEDEIKKLKEENVDLQQQLDEGFEQYTFLQGKTKELLDQFKQTKEENNRLTQEIESLKQSNNGDVEVILQEKQLLNNQLVLLEQRLRELETELIQKDGQIQSLGENTTTNNLNTEELISRIEQITRLADERENQIRELEARLVSGNELAIQLEEMQQILQERENIIAELNNRHRGDSQNQQQFQEMQQIIQERENIIAELNHRLQGHQEMQQIINERENIIEELNQRLQSQNEADSQNQQQFQEMEKIIRDGEIIIKGLEERLALQESVQAGKVDNNDLLNKIEDLTRILETKDIEIKNLQALNEETIVSLRALEEEREQALKSAQETRQERDEAVANAKEIQAEQSSMVERLSIIQRERDDLVNQLEQQEAKTAQLLEENSKSQGATTNIPEDILRELEGRIQGLEEERINLYEDREAVIRDRDNLILAVERLEADLAERNERTSGMPEGEELWNEIEGEYRGSKVMDYLDSMKSKLQIQRGLSAGKIVNLMLKEFEEAISELSKELEEKETTLIGLSRSLEELNEQNQKLQNNNAVLEGEQSEKEDYSSIRELYEKKTKRVEELLKEVNAKNSQLEALQIRIAHQHEVEEKGIEGEKNDLKEENELLRQEIAKEKERCLKVTEEYDNYKKKYKNNDEERGAIQHSYSQIIKNLSLQLDEMKKKKGISTAITVSKGIQTGEEEVPKKLSEEDFNQPGDSGKKGGFLSGMAKFFLTESEVKKI